MDNKNSGKYLRPRIKISFESVTAHNMLKHGFSRTGIFPGKDRIIEFVFTRENRVGANPYSGIFSTVRCNSYKLKKLDHDSSNHSIMQA